MPVEGISTALQLIPHSNVVLSWLSTMRITKKRGQDRMNPRFTPRELGIHGERVAEEHLVGLGYRILDRNWRWSRGELDLVAEQDAEIVFVEVKARRSQTFGSPEEAITRAKREKLIQSAYAYLGRARRQDSPWRIDVVAIDMERDGTVIRLEHIVSAVEGESF